MRKSFYLLIVLYSLIAAGCSTDDINNRDKRNTHWAWWVDATTHKGRWIPLSDSPTWKNGTYTKFYYNGQIYEKGTIKNGINVDTTFWFDLNSQIYAYRLVKEDSTPPYYIKNGLLKAFGKDGKILGDGIIQNHKIGDKWTEYYNSGFVKKIFNNIRDTGWEVNYYENGNIEDSMFIMGNKTGKIVKHWYENGQIAHSIGWKNLHYYGELLDYYENGQLRQTIQYGNGNPNGKGTYWYKSGKINGVVHYIDGKITGQQISYFENGQIQISGNMLDGKLDGEQKIYDENGTLVQDQFFKDGLRLK